MNTNSIQKTWISVIILILAGILLIGGVSASEFGPWSLQTVDRNGKVGAYSSVALDALGNPAISYYDETYGDLKYASWDGSTWLISTVDCSKSESKNYWFFWDRDHDRTRDSDYIRCFHGTERMGKYSSLAFDSSGKPRISFYDESKGDLKYASWDGSTWVITTVYSTGKVGEYSSLAFDNSDRPSISFYDGSHKDLMYASRSGTRWVITTVDGTNYKKGQKWGNWDGDRDRAQSNSINVGEYSSLALDSSGNPRISYYDESNKDLKYAAWDGTRWVITTVDGTNYKKGQKGCNWDGDYGRNQDKSIKVGKYSSLALDSSGNPRIGYYDESNKDLKYAAWDGTRWVITTVDRSKRVGEYASLKLDTNGDPRISYFDASHSDLKFAGWSSTTSRWVTETVDSSGKVGSFSSLVLDSQGNPGISYYDQSNKDLKYTAGTGHVQHPAAPTVTSLTPATGPAVGGTVITITGTGFTGATAVNFGTITGTCLTVNSATQLTVTSPPGAAGTVNVTVTTPNGTSAVTLAGQFTYTSPAAPTVTGITPDNGTFGTSVTVTNLAGTNFIVGTTPSVWLAKSGQSNIIATDVHVISPTQITCTLPIPLWTNTLEGQWDVVVQNADGQSGSKNAAFMISRPAPTVTSIDPNHAPNGTINNPVNVTGSNFGFGSNPSIWLAKSGESDIPASDVHIYGTTSMTFVLNIPLSASEGVRDVMIMSEDGQISANLGAFTIDKQIGYVPMTWNWDSNNGWDGWQTETTCPDSGSCSIYGPVILNGHGEYGSDISSAIGSSTESRVTKIFTPSPGSSWHTLSFSGLLSSSDQPGGRSMAIKVDGVDVYSATALQDPQLNGQPFTITATFPQKTTPVTVTISGRQEPIVFTSSYNMQFNSLTLS